MSKTISWRLKAFLSAELRTLMKNYEVFRANLAEIAKNGGNINELLREEILWEQKIKSLKSILRAETVHPVKQKDVIALGSQIILLYSDGKTQQIIVDGHGVKLKEQTVVNTYSPIGQMLIGRKQGDSIVAKGKEIKILTIGYPW